jgi:YesN/AraC family two-component response regulator
MSFSNKIILILDDEELVTSALKRELQFDYFIYTANNYKDALKILEENIVSIVISDYQMPEINGVDFLNIVKEKQINTVRILISAYSDFNIILNALNQSSIYAFIRKPWDINELKHLLNKALEYQTLLAEVNYSRSKLSALDQIKTDIVNILSNELNTPLTTLYGYVDMIKPNDDFTKVIINKIKQNLDRINSFSEDLRFIQDLQNRTYKEDKQDINLKKIINPFIECTKHDDENIKIKTLF